MLLTRTITVRAIIALLLSMVFSNNSIGQAIVRVRVLSVQTLNNVDCDGFLSGNSDFVWEFIGTDNTLGFSNNNPSALGGLFGDFNHAFKNDNNGPFTLIAPSGDFNPNSGLFFDHQYVCATDVPSQINLEWRAYENDDLFFNYNLLGLGSNGETSNQNVTMTVPIATGTTNYTYTASSTDGGCQQNYSITLQVERLPLVISYFEDNICDATNIALNTTYTLGWCPDATLEANEPRATDVAANGSVWFRFVAPASGSVQVTTDLGGTQFGTYFQLYHAADGSSCTTGLEPLTNNVIKDKFDYLSNYEFSDGLDNFFDPEADITLSSCSPVTGFSYQKLIPNETYYVQFTSDEANERGYYEVRVNSLGGSAPDLEDIPCLSSTVVPGTNQISSLASSPVTTNLSFGCAYDGGNSFGETGLAHTSTNPNQYHAYDYDHPAVNNADMNESVWLNFVAPNNGRMIFETDYQSAIYSESSALFGYDARFAPGIPSDYSCANLEDLYAQDGALNGLLGGSVQSAIIDARCLEPGYKYFGMIDPANALTDLSAQDIDTWLYDPSVVDPTTNPPGNDILCLAFANPLFEIPVTLAGTNPNFQAVAGTNEFACREYLAGEPAADPLQTNRADQTVWHYFVAPPSGAVEMNLRAYIGMNQLRYSIYELLNGTDCYGGLQPATFTSDGTKNTPVVTPLLQGVAGFSGTQESLCCLVPGKIYAVQLDGGSPGDEGQYIIEYIREIASDAGDIFVEMTNGTIINVNQPDTAFVCYGDTIYPGIMLNGIGETTLDIPSCLQLGYVIHTTNPVPNPVANTGFTFIDSVQTENGGFVNNSNGTGSFGNPLYNQLYYISPMADEPTNWGDLTCISSTVGAGLPLVFLQPIVPTSSYNNSNCEITFTCSGGLAGFNGTDFSYTISNASGNIVAVGTFAPSQNVVFPVPSAEVFTISVTDGACPYSFTIDATACANPCIVSPNLNFVSTTLCNGESIFLAGANQTTAGMYTDIFAAANGCDSTIYTTVTMIQPVEFSQTIYLCQGLSTNVGSSTYNSSGVYTDVLTAANGCDSTITTTLFVTSTFTSNFSEIICYGDSYAFGDNNLTTSGIYNTTLSASGGCDSIVTLFLTVRPLATSNINASICYGQSYPFGGQMLSATGSYNQTLSTVNGCDSIVTLNLTVLPIINGSTSATICQGQSYTFGTQVLTASGTYSQQFTTATGCDSIATLYLFVENQLTSNIDTAICMGETYDLGSQTITETGVYEELFTNAAGCDSLVHLEISVNDCSGPFEISNIVTPNEDGQNDTWKINHFEQISSCTVTIYNRWGQPVFETTNYHNEWGGTKDGESLPDGVYYYSIKCSNEEYKGSLNLFRLKK